MAGGQINLLEDPGWRLRNSTWMVPTLACCGAMTWVSFLYIGVNAKRRSWLAAAAAYGVASVIPIALFASAPTTAPGSSSTSSWQSTAGTICLLALWVGGSVHALIINRQWLAVLASPQDLATTSWSAASAPIMSETLGEPWRSYVSQALHWQREIVTAVANSPRGPMRDRLQVLADHVNTGMAECWRLAQAGQRLDNARARINTAAVAQQLNAIQTLQPDPSLTQAAQALQAQLDTATRMEREVSSTYNGLLLMNARLGEVAARVIELSVRPNAFKEVAAVESVVESVVDELVAVRQALTEMDG